MNSPNNSPKIAFVTGYVGLKFSAPIPKKPPHYDGYFITNNKWVYNRLKLTNWTPIFIDNTIEKLFYAPSEDLVKTFKNIKNADKITKQYVFTTACKPLKLYPQKFIQKSYDYVVWFDNKFNINTKGTIQTIKNWDSKIAMMLHRHPFVNNINGEFKESMYQERYIIDKESYLKYIEKNVSQGLSAEHHNHFQCGYLLYNMNHPDTMQIQETWHKHIKECGINDQISFNFVAQLFSEVITEYMYDIEEPKTSFLKRIFKK
ncbi:hypothetical protein [Aquimarina algicola]|uniref:DUF616 domain-containing protein n=1 Tax=Aquimarina algicola TaxID=2589995 RepID=A0A504JEG5_9FLAO|nr:hypothetical protein [Aquimarina algicola]TPN84781.1 hypothetical protein FHK87_17790 [Aquimarina algicola]